MPTYDELKENYLKQGYDANTAQTLASLDAVDAASSTDTTNTTPEVPVSTQTFDDGSSIQTYKDGSTLVTDSEGNQTFNSATAGATDAAGTTSGGQDVSSMAAAAAGIKAKPGSVIAWTEPESAANDKKQPIYPYNNVTQTKGGHSFEMDDTPTRERIRIQHGKGTFLEMHPDGNEVHKIIGDGYEIVLKDKKMLVKGMMYITVEGNAYVNVMGNKVEQIDGNYELLVKGHFKQTTQKTHSISTFGNMDITAGGPNPLGKLTVTVPDRIFINGSTSVSGSLAAGMISSKGRVDAETGMSAGPLGFVTTLGGVSAGLPAAIPLTIMASGPVASYTSVHAPLGTFGVSGSVLSFDVINMLVRKIESHISGAPGSPTSPPVQKELTISV